MLPTEEEAAAGEAEAMREAAGADTTLGCTLSHQPSYYVIAWTFKPVNIGTSTLLISIFKI